MPTALHVTKSNVSSPLQAFHNRMCLPVAAITCPEKHTLALVVMMDHDSDGFSPESTPACRCTSELHGTRCSSGVHDQNSALQHSQSLHLPAHTMHSQARYPRNIKTQVSKSIDDSESRKCNCLSTGFAPSTRCARPLSKNPNTVS